MKTKEETLNDRIRSFRYYLQGFINYLEPYRQKELSETEQVDTQRKVEPKCPSLRSPKGHRCPRASDVKLRGTPRKSNYSLGTHPNDFINPRLANQLKELEDYDRSHGNSKATIQKTIKETKRLLGWKVRFQEVEPLTLEDLIYYLGIEATEFEEARARLSAAEFGAWTAALTSDGWQWYEYEDVWYSHIDTFFEHVSLENLVPLVNLKVEIRSFQGNYENYCVAKVMALEKVAEAGDKVKQLLDAYQVFRNAPPQTEALTVLAVLHITEYLYKDQPTGRDFANLSIIGDLRDRLNNLMVAGANTPPTIDPNKKLIPWSHCFDVLHKLREEADQFEQYSKGSGVQSGYRERKRKESAVAASIQRFLSVALMVLIPPDRSRTYYELEMHRTLRFGYKEDDIFVPADLSELGSHTSKAHLWIHLEAEDYKTGKFYGLYEAILPNIPANDLGGNKTLYEYIALWWHEYRRSFNPEPSNNRFFIGRNGKLLNATDWSSRILNIFYKYKQKHVTPKELRTMYVIFLKSRDATLGEREGAWIAMHQSRKMQDEIYDKRKKEDKVAFIYDFNDRVRAEILEQGKRRGCNQNNADDVIHLKSAQVLSYMSRLDLKHRREFVRILSPRDRSLLGLS